MLLSVLRCYNVNITHSRKAQPIIIFFFNSARTVLLSLLQSWAPWWCSEFQLGKVNNIHIEIGVGAFNFLE